MVALAIPVPQPQTEIDPYDRLIEILSAVEAILQDDE